MELVDNKSKLWGDDLHREIKQDAKIKMVASYFSIYAFEAMKEELSYVEELEFIFPTPTFVRQGIKENIKKETREYYIPKHLRENSLYGSIKKYRASIQTLRSVMNTRYGLSDKT